jgi:hypothetical protein
MPTVRTNETVQFGSEAPPNGTLLHLRVQTQHNTAFTLPVLSQFLFVHVLELPFGTRNLFFLRSLRFPQQGVEAAVDLVDTGCTSGADNWLLQFCYHTYTTRVLVRVVLRCSIGGMIMTGENPILVPLCPQISHGLTLDRTRASAVRGRQRTA